MARMVSEVLALQPGARASLWAHILHLSREYVIGCETQGHWLAAKFGNTYQVYALLAYAGSARAWDKEGKIGVVAHQLPPVPPDSMEAVLYRNRGDAAITYWRFSRATGDAARWMSGLHRLHYFGANYPGDDGLAELWDLKAFDGVVLFERVTPTIPTPTGERVATPGSR